MATVETLMAAGRMRAGGLAQVEAARADGRWEAAHASQRAAKAPPDLATAPTGSAGASVAFERLGRSGRYAVILPLLKARTPQARAKILVRAVSQLTARE